jgi:hypothetical protein
MEEVKLRRSTKEDAPSQEHLDAIINALGKHKKFKDSAKREFAMLLLKESAILENISRGIENQPKVFREMRKRIKKARTALAAWMSFAGQHIDTSEIDIRAQNNIEARSKFKTSIQAFACYVNEVENIINETKLIKRKRGRSNLGAISMAKTIARLYHYVFKEYPASAGYSKVESSQKMADTPFDRVCSVMSKITGVEIPANTKRNAVKFVKNNSGIKKSDNSV